MDCLPALHRRQHFSDRAHAGAGGPKGTVHLYVHELALQLSIDSALDRALCDGQLAATARPDRGDLRLSPLSAGGAGIPARPRGPLGRLLRDPLVEPARHPGRYPDRDRHPGGGVFSGAQNHTAGSALCYLGLGLRDSGHRQRAFHHRFSGLPPVVRLPADDGPARAGRRYHAGGDSLHASEPHDLLTLYPGLHGIRVRQGQACQRLVSGSC
ncbi:hypothetical protein DESC_720089 [Desulfosarcina cetonica]|nr:hypothetical protein DESC_720089 [Desulfosarcina cetonica]